MILKLFLLLFTLMRCIQANVIYSNDKLNISEAGRILKTAPENAEFFLQISVPDHLEDPNILLKKDWLGIPSTQDYTKLSTPVNSVIIIHTATKTCNDQQTCSSIVRSIQNYHIDGKKWIDIGYNFLISSDGTIYTGRGWNNQGVFARNYNNKAIGIAFIGNFNDFSPTTKQLNAAKRLIELGVALHFISKDYSLFAHSQVSKTLSPGDALFEIIKTWPHWSSVVTN